MTPPFSNRQVQEWFFELQATYLELKSWRLQFDSAKRRAGACFPKEKKITVSRHHIELNDEKTVRDTLIHEVAHALTWIHHRSVGHGAQWKRWINQLGGIPRATARFNIPQAKWTLVLRSGDSLEPVAERHRRQKGIKNFMLIGRPETKGHLFYVKTEDKLLWERGELALDAIEFHQ